MMYIPTRSLFHMLARSILVCLGMALYSGLSARQLSITGCLQLAARG